MDSLDEHYMTLPEGVNRMGDPTPGMHRADPPWYRQRSLYGAATRSTFLGATIAAAWVSLALDLFSK